MDKFKLILVLLLLLLVAAGALAVLSLVATIVKYLLLAGLVVAAVGVASLALKKLGGTRQALEDSDAELERADLLLEDMRRKQLPR